MCSKIFFYNFFCFIIFFSLYSNDFEIINENYDYSSVVVLEVIHSKLSVVSIIQDRKGNKYCIKQPKNIEKKLHRIIAEVLSCTIAQSMNIPVVKARIIPAHQNIPGKFFEDMPAIIQTYASGVPLNTPNPFRGMNIKQRNRDSGRMGLQRKNIFAMSKHEDLPLIVALDTFIGNYDRSGSNIFYDERNDSFCGIDMDRSFQVNLAVLAYEFLYNFKDSKDEFLSEEIKALEVYCNTTRELLLKNPFTIQLSLLKNLIVSCGVFAGKSKKVLRKKFFKEFEDNIVNSYKDCIKLVCLLDTMLHKLKKD